MEKNAYLANSYLAGTPTGTLLDLTREVALLKAILERKTALIKDEHSFMMHSGGLPDLILKINTVVLNCTKLQERLGRVLTAEQAVGFASEILEIIAEEVEDHDVLAKIQGRVLASLDQLTANAGDSRLGKPEIG